MLTEARINSALKKLADAFLNDLRSLQADQLLSGWGQFVGQPSGTQVGLYGTCAGLICVALAYGPDHIPEAVVRYLKSLWDERNTPGSNGARNFALTARRAFFLLSLRQSHHKVLEELIPDSDRELRERILPDGLFVSWQIDAANRAPTGNETTTSLAILAYGLTGPKAEIPPEVQKSAMSLQARVEGAPSANLGVRKFLLTSIAFALEQGSLRQNIKRLIATNRITANTRDQDMLYYWDYKYKGSGDALSRRDYLHVPSDAVDILLASTASASRDQRRAAFGLSEEVANAIIKSGLYFGGREPATSKSQAWIGLALEQAKSLLETEPNQEATGQSNRFAKFWALLK